ncbi:MAG TPA: TspO/MBR family protein [Longimicrobiales bacterium]|nr:TspO/MBR family protein [Longimicrobiales bacterium]
MSSAPSPHGRSRQLVNVAVLAAVLWANALAGSGALSGESIGLIANRYPSTFLPANWVFGIWSLIYLWLVLFTAYQALPSQRQNQALARVGWGWAVNGALNIAWVALFSFSLFGPALGVMAMLLVNLVWLVERTGWPDGRLGWMDRIFVAWPFGLYLAWISVALIANTFQYLTYLRWSGLGISAEAWSALMMVVATGLSAFMVLARGNWLFPVVFAWAFLGIADRFADVPLISNTAYAMTGVGLGVLPLGLLRRRRRGLAA